MPIDELEEKTFEEDDSSDLPPSDIVAYNELRSCADLFRMHTQGALIIQPEFQREIVWKTAAQTRFVDSLIKQLPIPSMCFSLDYKLQEWQVIDGLQRIWSIVRFLSGGDWRLSELQDIDPKISGRAAKDFADQKSPLHSYYKRVENLTLPITVLRCDYSKKSHANYLFTIFHRLNTGAMKLNNQEIRNCIFSGPFNDLLKSLNKNSHWKRLNRMKEEVGFRFTKEELILRVFAFSDRLEGYKGQLAKFLNNYMQDNRQCDAAFASAKEQFFNRTVEIVYKKIYAGKVPPKLIVTLLEAMLVGVGANLDHLEALPAHRVKELAEELRHHEEFTAEKLSEGLAKTERVTNRIRAAKAVFSKQ